MYVFFHHRRYFYALLLNQSYHLYTYAQLWNLKAIAALALRATSCCGDQIRSLFLVHDLCDKLNLYFSVLFSDDTADGNEIHTTSAGKGASA